MLFYSYSFVLIFLPLVAAIFFLTARLSRRLAAAWLAGASLVFYGYWNAAFVLLIMASITFNFTVAYWMARRRGTIPIKGLLVAAVVVNLAVLGYCKYMNFFIANANLLLHSHWSAAQIVLPLGISIFTFTQIAFLSDVASGIATEYNYLHYVLFVTYFPHLIAGPIIHHRAIMPQFDAPATYQAHAENFAVGLTIFTIGLAKKVVLAATFAEYANPVFDAAVKLPSVSFGASWTAVLAYTLQIYFDFSGYSDMAIGLSRIFGIRLPENFNSPYKAHSIIEFWRRWNMTLSRFLRDYLYIPLGGNRRGPRRRYLNLAITMLLGGLWHGAQWTFVVWGGLHAGYLILNHGWERVTRRFSRLRHPPAVLARIAGAAVTFLAVVVAWVFFRADSLAAATRVLEGMVRCSDLAGWRAALPSSVDTLFPGYWFPHDSVRYVMGSLTLGLGLVWFAPNTRELVAAARVATPRMKLVVIGNASFWIFVLVAISASRNVSEFIYFNF